MFEQLIISIQILFIDIVMAADNAIIIGLIAANFAKDNRRKIIAWGVAAAFIFRIIFAFGASYMFEFAWIKITNPREEGSPAHVSQTFFFCFCF